MPADERATALAKAWEHPFHQKDRPMLHGTQIWWKRGSTSLPALFEAWRRRGAIIQTPHNGRIHEARRALLLPASDAEAWQARVAELRAAELAEEERRRLLDSNVLVADLVREIERSNVPCRIRRHTVETVLGAVRRLEEEGERRR